MTANELLTEVANQLDVWADESVKGGWSTHQVDAMRKLADRIRREQHRMLREAIREFEAQHQI